MYIIFEGVDTSGKSTQIELLKKEYKNALFTKEPGGTKFGESIRSIILDDGVVSHVAELFLFLADRAEHYEKVIKPNLDKLIISDRGFISGISYALTNNKSFDIDTLIQLNRLALLDTLPDLVVLFKTDRDLIKSRLNTKDRDVIEQRGIDYLVEVQTNMQNILKELSIRYEIIDSRDSIESIHKKIKGFIND
jgi:dTMP kinase